MMSENRGFVEAVTPSLATGTIRTPRFCGVVRGCCYAHECPNLANRKSRGNSFYALLSRSSPLRHGSRIEWAALCPATPYTSADSYLNRRNPSRARTRSDGEMLGSPTGSTALDPRGRVGLGRQEKWREHFVVREDSFGVIEPHDFPFRIRDIGSDVGRISEALSDERIRHVGPVRAPAPIAG